MGIKQKVLRPGPSPHQEGGRRPGIFSSALKKLRGFALAVPLAASLSLGACAKDPCYSHNETTQSLNRKTNGLSRMVPELEGSSWKIPLDPQLADFVNETHMLSTQGMPEGVTITKTDKSCSQKKGLQATAYARARSDFTHDRGIYFPGGKVIFPIDLMMLVSHELGHMQQDGAADHSEVISTLNAEEQMLMGFVLLHGQGAPKRDLIRFVHHIDRLGLPSRLNGILYMINEGLIGDEDLSIYDLADFFIFNKLEASGGDFSYVRNTTRGFDADSYAGEVERVAGMAINESLDMAPSEIALKTRLHHHRALLARFGHEEASAYLQTASNLVGSLPVTGLDGLACSSGDILKDADATRCEDRECVLKGAYMQAPVNLSLCCLDPDIQRGVLVKVQVEASGRMLTDNGRGMSFFGYRYPALISIGDYSKTFPSIGDRCR
ncbi:MAG: hypothetical protein V1827_02590 [Candidatus Micrarchaeota archaeon]